MSPLYKFFAKFWVCYSLPYVFFCFGLFFICCNHEQKIGFHKLPKHGLIYSFQHSLLSNLALEKARKLHSILTTKDYTNLSTAEVIYPEDNSLFPPDMVPPTIKWKNSNGDIAGWTIEFGETEKILVAKSLSGPPPLQIDSGAIPDNAPFRLKPETGTEYYPIPNNIWDVIKSWPKNSAINIRITGFDNKNKPLIQNTRTFSISSDSVGAPVFYRDVPFMPVLNQKKSAILPLDDFNMKFINWRLRDLARPESKVVMSDMPTCANCHTFSKDGQKLGMDIDGTQGDKGAYGIQSLSKKMVYNRENIVSWNHDYVGEKTTNLTFGFLSSLSPDGSTAVTTINEKLFVVGYIDKEYSQVFYPTRGILAWYNPKDKKAYPLPGADDTAYVHCSPTWTPDGKTIIFSRAKAKDPYTPNQKMPAKANDPEETPIQYSLYRIPFNNGKGGKAIPIQGASFNGKSNSFAKVSPDGKYVVWVQARNGLLMRPDSKLWILPIDGGTPRELDCNSNNMNSWHSFSPNSRWLVFTSKKYSMYTQMFLTHIDPNGKDSPAILIPNSTAHNRASNLPEFANIKYEDLDTIETPAVSHFRYRLEAGKNIDAGNRPKALHYLRKILEEEKKDKMIRAEVMSTIGDLLEDKSESLKMYQQAVEIDPNYTQGWMNLGIAYSELGKEDKAIAAYHRSLKINPNNYFSMIQLCKIHMFPDKPKNKDLKLALTYITKANELTYFQLEYPLQNLARVYSVLGDFSKAVEYGELGLQRAQEKKNVDQAQKIENELNAYRKNVSFLALAHKTK